MGVPGGLAEAVQLRIDLVHLHIKAHGKSTLHVMQNIAADAFVERMQDYSSPLWHGVTMFEQGATLPRTRAPETR
jgi:hypothetical protein